MTFWSFPTQIRSPSWPLTFGGPWLPEWWADPAVLGPQGIPEWLVLLDIRVPVDHQATEACQENWAIQVPEVTSTIRRLSVTGPERIHLKQFPPLTKFLGFPGDVGEAGDKGSIGRAIDGPPGDQGYQGNLS